MHRRLIWIILAAVILIGGTAGWLFLRPPSAQALLERGIAKRERGDFAGAIVDLTKALGRNPDLREAQFQRALTYCGKGDWEAACNDFNEVIERSGGTQAAPARAGRAWARLHQGDLAGTLEDCDLAIEHAPRFPMAYVRRGQAKAARGDSAAAIEDFSKAIELDGHCTEAWSSRGYERLKVGQIPQGHSDLAEAKRLQNGGS